MVQSGLWVHIPHLASLLENTAFRGGVVLMDALQKIPVQKCCCSFITLNRERWCLSSPPPPVFGALAQLVTAFWPRNGNGEAARAPSQCPAIQMGNRGMDMLCRNPAHWQHPLWGGDIQASARAKGHQRGAGTLLQARTGQADGEGQEGCIRAHNS